MTKDQPVTQSAVTVAERQRDLLASYAIVPVEAPLIIDALEELRERMVSDPTWTDEMEMTVSTVTAKMRKLLALAAA